MRPPAVLSSDPHCESERHFQVISPLSPRIRDSRFRHSVKYVSSGAKRRTLAISRPSRGRAALLAAICQRRKSGLTRKPLLGSESVAEAAELYRMKPLRISFRAMTWKRQAATRPLYVAYGRSPHHVYGTLNDNEPLFWASRLSGQPASLGHNAAARRKSRLSGTGLTEPSLGTDECRTGRAYQQDPRDRQHQIFRFGSAPDASLSALGKQSSEMPGHRNPKTPGVK
jgi:hypothetical protein